jgi:phytoene/squalene synthetase
VGDAQSLRQSDAVCSALQLINFWQDLAQDVARGRYYLPAQDCARHGLDWRAPDPARTPALVRELCTWARELMLQGGPLVHRVPGRAGWELRLVVQGGLRVLQRIDAIGGRTLDHRPKLHAPDVLPMLWHAVRM